MQSPSIQVNLLSQCSGGVASTTSEGSKMKVQIPVFSWKMGSDSLLIPTVTSPHRMHKVPHVFHLPIDTTQL